MPKLDEILKLAEKGINQFIAICTNTNRDLPFHDYYDSDYYDDTGSYDVGHNQIMKTGDQKKLFVSKSTLVYSTADCFIYFNSMNNAPVFILANTYFEFESNIFVVLWDKELRTGYLYLWFEGVMFNEARRPH